MGGLRRWGTTDRRDSELYLGGRRVELLSQAQDGFSQHARSRTFSYVAEWDDWTERQFFLEIPLQIDTTRWRFRGISQPHFAYIPDGGSLFLSLSLCVCLFLCTYRAHSLDGVSFGREATQRARGSCHARFGGHLILVLVLFAFFPTSSIPCFFPSAASLCACSPNGCGFVLVSESGQAG